MLNTQSAINFYLRRKYSTQELKDNIVYLSSHISDRFAAKCFRTQILTKVMRAKWWEIETTTQSNYTLVNTIDWIRPCFKELNDTPRTNFLKTIGCYLTLLLRFISLCHLIIKCRQCTQWWLHDTYNLESVNSGFTNDISRSWYSIVHIICLRM